MIKTLTAFRPGDADVRHSDRVDFTKITPSEVKQNVPMPL